MGLAADGGEARLGPKIISRSRAEIAERRCQFLATAARRGRKAAPVSHPLHPHNERPGRNNPKEFVSVRVAADALMGGLHWDPLAPIGFFPFPPDRGFFLGRARAAAEGDPDL